MAHLSIIVPHSTGFPVVIPRFVGIPIPRIRTLFIALAIPILVAQSLAPRSRCSLLARWSSFSVLVARTFTSVPGPCIGFHWPQLLFLICWNPFPVIPLARSPFIGLSFPVPAPLVGLPSLCIPTSSSNQSSFILAFLIHGLVLVFPRGPHSWLLVLICRSWSLLASVLVHWPSGSSFVSLSSSGVGRCPQSCAVWFTCGGG